MRMMHPQEKTMQLNIIFSHFSVIVNEFMYSGTLPYDHPLNVITLFYYTTQVVRGPITKINQLNCSIASPIFLKYWTGHCPEWSRTCVFAVFAFFSRVINLLLTKLARDRTGRISALGLFSTVLTVKTSGQYSPSTVLALGTPERNCARPTRDSLEIFLTF